MGAGQDKTPVLWDGAGKKGLRIAQGGFFRAD